MTAVAWSGRRGAGRWLALGSAVALGLTLLVAAPRPAAAACPAAGGDPAPFTTDETQLVEDAALVLNGGGWGHGVGMSQYGAQGGALLGCDHATILATYYPGTAIQPLDGARSQVAVHLLARAYEPTTIRTTSASAGGRDLPWVACAESGDDCATVATQPAGSEWQVRPLSDGTFVLFSDGDGTQCPITDTSTTTSEPSPTESPSPEPSPTATDESPPPGCHWRGGDIYTRLRMQHDGTVIRIVEASGRRVKWGFTEFDFSTVNGGTTYITQYVTGGDGLAALDRYLFGLAEMPSSWEVEALRAQAIAGRSYAEATIRTRESAFGRHPVGGYIEQQGCRCDLWATTRDQVYHGFDHEDAETGRWKQAVIDTAGKAMMYGGAPIAAFYSSSHGGSSEDVEHVWGADLDYLPAVDTSRWEAETAYSEERRSGNTRYRWTRSFTAADLASRLGFASVDSFVIEERGPGGRPTRMNGGGAVVTGTDSSGAALTKRYSGETLRWKLSLFSSLVHVDGEPPTATEPPAPVIEDACPSDRVPEDGFDDVMEGTTHEPAIDCVVWWAVANGVSETRYDPAGKVRREQMASFLVRTLEAAGVELPAEPADHFDDDNDSAHVLAIDQLAELQLVNGTGERTFAPNELVTRDQMAAFLVRITEHALGHELEAGEDRFTDDEGNPHEPSIDKVANAGIASGVGDGRYDPRGHVRRDQMGSFLARTLAVLVRAGVTAPPP